MTTPISRRAMIGDVAKLAAALALPAPIFDTFDPDRARFDDWTFALRSTRFGDRSVSLGLAAARVGELALGTPYEANILEAYLRAGGRTGIEPLTLSLTLLAIASVTDRFMIANLIGAADAGDPTRCVRRARRRVRPDRRRAA